MASIIKKEKINNCLKGIRTCIKSITNTDYEFVSYEKSVDLIKPEIINNLKSTIHSKVQINHHNGLKKQKAQSNLIDKFNLVSTQPKFHSTCLERDLDCTNDDESICNSAFDLSTKSRILNNKITVDCSQINDDDCYLESFNAFSNPTYLSPILQRSQSLNSFRAVSDPLNGQLTVDCYKYINPKCINV